MCDGGSGETQTGTPSNSTNQVKLVPKEHGKKMEMVGSGFPEQERRGRGRVYSNSCRQKGEKERKWTVTYALEPQGSLQITRKQISKGDENFSTRKKSSEYETTVTSTPGMLERWTRGEETPGQLIVE